MLRHAITGYLSPFGQPLFPFPERTPIRKAANPSAPLRRLTVCQLLIVNCYKTCADRLAASPQGAKKRVLRKPYCYMIIESAFFQRPDVLQIARELLGKHLCTGLHGQLTAGRVIETEAYRHVGDHSLTLHLQRKRRQAQALYAAGGVAYIYTVYRVHSLFNIVCNDAEHPDTVLIRAIEPTRGEDFMRMRRQFEGPAKKLASGPGLLSRALGLTPALSGEPVTGPLIWFEDHGEEVAETAVLTGPRIGLEYAGAEAASLPWRFRLKA